jgi:hypothetical protein
MRKMNEREIPPAALRDVDAVEMLRVWIAEHGLHCSMKLGMYEESTEIPEDKAWGIILADIARHAASGLSRGYGGSYEDKLEQVSNSFEKELKAPSRRNMRGGFTDER